MSRPSFFEPLYEMQPLVRRSVSVSASRIAAKSMIAAGNATHTVDPSATVAAVACTRPGIHVTRLLVDGSALDVKQIQRDTRTASRNKAWALLLTPEHIDARMNDDDVREVLMRQLPMGCYQPYDDLVESVNALRVVDYCMNHLADADAIERAAVAFGVSRERMADRVHALVQIEKEPRLPDGYERVARVRHRRERRLAAIDRIVDAYRRVLQGVAMAEASATAISIAASLSSLSPSPPPPPTAAAAAAAPAANAAPTR